MGYSVLRRYDSMIDPHRQTNYTKIVDGGDSTLFLVEAQDQPGNPIVAASPSGAWMQVVKKSHECRNTRYYYSGKGNHNFGLDIPQIIKMIQDLPGATDLVNYQWKNFDQEE